MVYRCGEKPGKGRYICINCGEDLYLDDEMDAILPCEKCNSCYFQKGFDMRYT
ncbi:MAG: zinc ribbon-containing protein [Methanocellales archaeon]|nr:zinc ribbon-containing protein [Methanocellales archaeon]